MVCFKKNRWGIIVLLSFLFMLNVTAVRAQRVAVKTNTLGWLAASPNIEAEFSLSRHFTLNMGLMANPLSTSKFKTNFVHFQPEVRYWLNRPMVSHFVGATAFINDYNMMFDDVYRKGNALAAGLTYGYAWTLGEHWNIEATAGVGVLRYRQFKYDKGTSKPDEVNDRKTTVAPVKLGISLVYIIR